jgi:uncharacterized DUF497 family protein
MYDYVYKCLIKFTWDETKRKLNLKVHRIDFADAEKVFNGPMRIFEDVRFDYGEHRWIGVGLLGYDVVVIVHTEAADSIRIISMRKATTNEQKIFFDE